MRLIANVMAMAFFSNISVVFIFLTRFILYLCAPWLLPVIKRAAEQQISSIGVDFKEKLQHRSRNQLTDREVQTAILLLAGHSSKAIAAQLAISPETVKVHRRNLYEKLNVSSQAEVFFFLFRV